MPTYQYKCPDCDYRFEEFQLITEEPLTKCPQCNSNSVKRLITGGAGFIFKGTGFYITDHRSESYKKDAQKDRPIVEPASSSKKKESTKKKAV